MSIRERRVVMVAAGYKTNVIGFGRTNGVYSHMHAMLVAVPAGGGSESE